MARVCEVCGKGKQIGYNVSHANNRTKRVWLPNLQTKKVVMGNTTKKIRVCTKCLKKGLVKVAV